jgi:hypothetical protein
LLPCFGEFFQATPNIAPVPELLLKGEYLCIKFDEFLPVAHSGRP